MVFLSLYYVLVEMVIDGSVCSSQLPRKKKMKGGKTAKKNAIEDNEDASCFKTDENEEG
jgi:hypothetical protein